MSETETDSAAAVREFMSGRGFSPAPALRQSVIGAMESDPEGEAELRRVAKRTGVSLLAARIAPDEVKRQARVQAMDLDGMVQQFPATARWMLDQDNARLAHDDTDVLKSIEAAAKYVTTGRGGVGGDLVGGLLFDGSAGAAGAFRSILEFMAMLPDGMPENRALRAGIDWFSRQAATAKRTADAMGSKPEGIVSSGVASGVRSFGRNLSMLPLAFMPGGQGAAMAGMTGVSGGPAHTVLRGPA